MRSTLVFVVAVVGCAAPPDHMPQSTLSAPPPVVEPVDRPDLAPPLQSMSDAGAVPVADIAPAAGEDALLPQFDAGDPVEDLAPGPDLLPAPDLAPACGRGGDPCCTAPGALLGTCDPGMVCMAVAQDCFAHTSTRCVPKAQPCGQGAGAPCCGLGLCAALLVCSGGVCRACQ